MFFCLVSTKERGAEVEQVYMKLTLWSEEVSVDGFHENDQKAERLIKRGLRKMGLEEPTWAKQMLDISPLNTDTGMTHTFARSECSGLDAFLVEILKKKKKKPCHFPSINVKLLLFVNRSVPYNFFHKIWPFTIVHVKNGCFVHF